LVTVHPGCFYTRENGELFAMGVGGGGGVVLFGFGFGFVSFVVVQEECACGVGRGVCEEFGEEGGESS